MFPEYKGKEGGNKEIIKEINTIISCLSELKDHAPFVEKNRISNIIKYSVLISTMVSYGLARLSLLGFYCIAVNSIEIKPTRKSVKVEVGVDLGKLKALRSKGENNF